MSSHSFTRMDIYTPVTLNTLSRTQERAELQQLNDRFAAYVQRVRMLAEKNSQVDSSALLQSARSMEMEIHNLKNMYEQELDKLRKELEISNHERTTHQVQVNKQMQISSELQERLNMETDKNSKMLDDINNYQRRMGNLESEIQDLRVAASRPNADIEQLQKTVAALTRENETLKHRYEHEQVARQEAETRIQHLMQKSEFSDKVSAERIGELNSRIDMSAATILSLEAKVRDLAKTDVSVSEMLKQVRETAEGELRKYQMESEEQYNKNLSALKVQMDADAKIVQTLETERNQLRGGMGELQARIRTLEGQVASLEHQKQTLESAVAAERSRAAEGAQSLERKLREMQEMMMVKIREVSSARENNLPLKAEIEALKALLEEEEKRLKLSMGATTTSYNTTTAADSTFQTSYNATTTTANIPDTSAIATTTSDGAAYTTMSSRYNQLPPTFTSYARPSSPYFSQALTSQNNVTFAADSHPYAPSPPLSVTYIPEGLRPLGVTGTSVDPMFTFPQYEDELDPQLFGYSGSMPRDLVRNDYPDSGVGMMRMEPSPPMTPRAAAARTKSAPENRQVAPTDKKGERHRNLNLVRSDLGQGHDYFDRMFYDLQRDTLYSRDRPRSGGSQNNQPLSSVHHDYAVTTSSSTGDVKIMEVHQDGKYVRLMNEGAEEVDFGGYMIQQNVGGHPVAVYRFPPRTKFGANSTLTVYSGSTDRKLHNPPKDIVWKEQQKWGSGPECTTILSKANGQAVAWTTAAHRFTRDPYQDADKDEKVDDGMDNDSLNGSVSKSETGLRREKQQPPSLPSREANNNSYQTSRPELAPVQKTGSSGQRKYISGISTSQPSAVRGNGKTDYEGETSDEPSPFMKPHARLQSGLDQVLSQQTPHFLPPMPRPPYV